MKTALLVFCVLGLFYCIIQIVLRFLEFLKCYSMFRYVSIMFNVQYQILGKYLNEEMTSRQIIDEIKKENPEIIELISEKQQIVVLYVKGIGEICENTEEIRNAFVKAGTLMEKLKEYFKLHNIVFYEGVYDENELFLKQLKQIRIEKGEYTVWNEDNVEEDNSVEQ